MFHLHEPDDRSAMTGMGTCSSSRSSNTSSRLNDVELSGWKTYVGGVNVAKQAPVAQAAVNLSCSNA